MAFSRAQYDVVLVSPPASVVREHWDKPDFPAIGVAYIGHFLERRRGIAPAIIDGKLSRLDVPETVRQIAALAPRIVGLSAMTHEITTAHEIATRLKEELPAAHVVLGGFHGTALPERTLREFASFDFVVVGEGEVAFAELVDRLLSGRPAGRIPGVACLDDGRFVDQGRGVVPGSLDHLGTPGWHLFDPEVMRQYCRLLPLMSQRGCPFECNFCSRPYGRTLRKRDPETICDEIEAGRSAYGVDRFTFFDETFTVDPGHVEGICSGLVERGLGGAIRWSAMVHANTVRAGTLAAMKAAGCDFLYFGVESGNADTIRRMKKGITKARILRCAGLLRDAKIPFGAMFILGHPDETRRTIFDTLLFAVRIGSAHTVFGIMVPYPGTEIWDMALRGEGGYAPVSPRWEDYNKQIGNALRLKRIGRRELELYQMIGYLAVDLSRLRIGSMVSSAVKHRARIAFALRKVFGPARRIESRAGS
ncbi:MAG: radical SAM protein [Planctomycetota bacterium]